MGLPGRDDIQGSHSCGSSGTKSFRLSPSLCLPLSGHSTLWLQISVFSLQAQGSLSRETDSLVTRPLHRRPITAGETNQRCSRRRLSRQQGFKDFGRCLTPLTNWPRSASRGSSRPREAGAAWGGQRGRRNDPAQSAEGKPSPRRGPQLGCGAGHHRTHLTTPS